MYDVQIGRWMADRVGVISKGRLLLVEEKAALMTKLGTRELDLILVEPLDRVPPELAEWSPTLEDEVRVLRYVFNATEDRTGIPSLLNRVRELGIAFKDLETSKSSLEDIFVGLVEEKR